MKKYIAELLGTFALTLAVALSLAGVFPVPTPVIAALTLGLFVYSIGHISGTHINPAVTIGLWSVGKIDMKTAGGYIASQFIGAWFAWVLAAAFVTLPTLAVSNGWEVGVGEGIGMFFFAFGIASVVFEKAPSVFSGAVVGGSLLLGVSLAAGIGTNGVLNPAVVFGIGSFSWMYLLGPLVGSILGMQAYKHLQ